jgi:hypothetical protein
VKTFLKLLSDISYHSGLIGLPEYIERCVIADWLAEESHEYRDPRPELENYEGSDEAPSKEDLSTSNKEDDNNDGYLELKRLNTWVFTIGDRDCYPSVPHGHYQKKTTPCPKLNPYTGRVHKKNQAEVANMRLSKAEMITLWSDEEFREHCREQIMWYTRFAPRYEFPNARFGRDVLPKWK